MKLEELLEMKDLKASPEQKAAWAEVRAQNKAAAVKARAAEKKRGKRDKNDDDSSSESAMLHGVDEGQQNQIEYAQEVEHYYGDSLDSLAIDPIDLDNLIRNFMRMGYVPEEGANELNDIMNDQSEYFDYFPPRRPGRKGTIETKQRR